MTNSNQSAFESRLQSYLEDQPEFSLAWEILQHGRHSWDDGMLSWAIAMAQSHSFYDLYGISAKSDFDADAFVLEGGHLDECLAILQANSDHDEAPSALFDDFLFELYFFGMKRRTVETLDHLAIDY